MATVDTDKPTVNSHEVVVAFAVAYKLDPAVDDNLLFALRELAVATGVRCECTLSNGQLRVCLPPQRGRKTRYSPKRNKHFGYSRPTEALAIGRITGDERRRAAREERIAAAEAREEGQ